MKLLKLMRLRNKDVFDMFKISKLKESVSPPKKNNKIWGRRFETACNSFIRRAETSEVKTKEELKGTDYLWKKYEKM